jgi:hypothetical protein
MPPRHRPMTMPLPLRPGPRRLLVLGSALAICSTLSLPVEAQSPTALPLVQAGNLAYLGSFTLPSSDGTGQPGEAGSLLYGGRGLAVRDETLYFGCHQYSDALARVSIPATGGVASIVEPCVRVPNLEGVDGSDGGEREIGGGLWHGGRLIVSGYAFYDADGDAVASHFAGGSVASLVGPVRLSGAEPGAVGGYMAVVPEEWRALLGGPALTGLCCVSIITRSSFGPSVSVFNPDDVGVRTPVPSTLLVRYGSDEFPASGGDWRGMIVGGVAFPAGTRSVLFVGRAGVGPTCYGTGLECGDPTSSPKGYHSYPYRHRVWAYDANDLLAVKQGRRRPNEVQPYGVWDLPEMQPAAGDAPMRSATYDPATRRLYVVTDSGSAAPRVHVYLVTTAVIQPPRLEPEVCGDLIDNDRDGQVDEGCPSATAVPDAPVHVTAGVTSRTVSLSWRPAITGAMASEYLVEAGLAPGRADYVLPTGTSTGLTAPNVGVGRYYVRVRAKNANGPGPPSDEFVVTVGCSVAPRPVTSLAAKVVAGLVRLSWKDPDGCSGAAYRVVVASATTPEIATVMTTTAPTAAALLPQGSYVARVVAVADGSTLQSSAASVSMTVAGSGCPVPAFATAFGARINGRVVGFFWSPVAPDDAGASDSLSPVSYVLEAGSRPGTADIITIPLGRASNFAATAPVGTYFVRIRPISACGAGNPSNELQIIIR